MYTTGGELAVDRHPSLRTLRGSSSCAFIPFPATLRSTSCVLNMLMGRTFVREWPVCLWSVIAEGLGDVDKGYKGVAGLSDVVSAMIATSLDGGVSGPMW